MTSKKPFYITTTLPYINSEPHLGFAAEIIKADVIARYKRQAGYAVFFNTGTDEHGLKIYQKALEMGLTIQAYCDQYSAKFRPLKEILNLSFDKFIRTTDPDHQRAVQAFWKLCVERGDIYKKKYQVKYCVGCEMDKTDSELINGRCPWHPNRDLEVIEEDNYFFRFSKYQTELLSLYESRPDFVLPASRLKEIKTFVASGLQDFSISRRKDKMPHGVPVPGDNDQVMYVWFDALINYISTLGWPANLENFEKYWPGLQVCGKDNLRPQAAMWPAMLLSAGLPVPSQILVFGFLTVNGQKISKSLGNTVDFKELVNRYGADALRYYLLAEIPPYEDGDYSIDKFKERYNADLANGIGNLVARISNLLEKNEIVTDFILADVLAEATWLNDVQEKMATYRFNEVLQIIWLKIKESNEALTASAPWKLTERAEIANVLKPLAREILIIAFALEPFIPTASLKIQAQFLKPQIKKGDILFPRVE